VCGVCQECLAEGKKHTESLGVRDVPWPTRKPSCSRKRLSGLTICPEASELFFARGEIFNTQKISEPFLCLGKTTILCDHNQIIDVPLLVAGTETMESHLIFPIDITRKLSLLSEWKGQNERKRYLPVGLKSIPNNLLA